MTQIFTKKSKKGFTLVELLLVVALIAISVGVTSDILVSLVRSYNKTRVTTEIEQQAGFVSSKLDKELRNSIGIVGSVTDTDTLTFQDRDGTQVTYAVSGGKITYTRGGTTSDLTSNFVPGGVSVQCSFTYDGYANSNCFHVSGASPKVVTYTMRFTQSDTSGASVTFTGALVINNTIVLRNTY